MPVVACVPCDRSSSLRLCSYFQRSRLNWQIQPFLQADHVNISEVIFDPTKCAAERLSAHKIFDSWYSRMMFVFRSYLSRGEHFQPASKSVESWMFSTYECHGFEDDLFHRSSLPLFNKDTAFYTSFRFVVPI